MAIRRGVVQALICLLIMVGPAVAEEQKQQDLPWQKVNINLGVYWAGIDSSMKISSKEHGIGLALDFEDALGLDVQNSAFRIDTGWRFTKNKRHKVEFSWFRFKREGNKYLPNVIEIPDGENGTTTIGPGTTESVFDIEIYKLKYEYSFILDERVDFNFGLGLFVMPIEFGFEGTIDGVGQQRLLEDITAPLPVLGLGFDFAITPKWFFRQQVDLLYLEYGDFKGSIVNTLTSIEYLPWKHVGFGLGVDYMRIHLEADGNDYPGTDFKGAVQYDMLGAQFYMKFYL